MGTFKESLEAYGADYEGIMRRFMQNEAMYQKMLTLFFKDDNMEKLGDALNAGDIVGAYEAAHTLKGVAGNLGLTPLYEAVSDIVEPLRRKETDCDYTGLYRVVQEEFRRVETLRDELKNSGSV